MAKSTPLKVVRPSVKAIEFKPGNSKNAIAAADGKRTMDLQMIPIDQIKVMPGLQPRLMDEIGYEEGIEALVNSIMQFGFMKGKPLEVFASVDEDFANVIYVWDGHGRLEATKRANLKEKGIEALPCVFMEPTGDAMSEASMMIRNTTQRELTPLAQAVHVRRMLDAKKTHAEIAEILGITRRYVYEHDALSRAPRQVLDLIKSGDLSARKAMALIKKNEDDREALIAAAADVAEKKAAKVLAKENAAVAKANGEAAPVKAKMLRRSFEIKGEDGDEITREEAERFSVFLGEEYTDWWKPARSKKKALLTRRVAFRMSVAYEASETEPEDVADADDGGLPPVEEEAAPRKRGRKAAAEAVDDLSDIADRA